METQVSNTPEHDARAPEGDAPHPDVRAARTYVESVRDTADIKHDGIAWHPEGMREAFLAGITYGRNTHPDLATWVVGYSRFEMAFHEVLGLEGNVPPDMARTALKELKRDLDELRAVAARAPAQAALVPARGVHAAEGGCPACGAARSAQQSRAIQPYACGSWVQYRVNSQPQEPMFAQSVPCLRGSIEHARRFSRDAELGVRIRVVLEQNEVRTEEDCNDVAGFMRHASSTGVAMMNTIREWMKGALG
jgi:hypothetical protein